MIRAGERIAQAIGTALHRIGVRPKRQGLIADLSHLDAATQASALAAGFGEPIYALPVDRAAIAGRVYASVQERRIQHAVQELQHAIDDAKRYGIRTALTVARSDTVSAYTYRGKAE